jgi:hypothetical protein
VPIFIYQEKSNTFLKTPTIGFWKINLSNTSGHHTGLTAFSPANLRQYTSGPKYATNRHIQNDKYPATLQLFVPSLRGNISRHVMESY